MNFVVKTTSAFRSFVFYKFRYTTASMRTTLFCFKHLLILRLMCFGLIFTIRVLAGCACCTVVWVNLCVVLTQHTCSMHFVPRTFSAWKLVEMRRKTYLWHCIYEIAISVRNTQINSEAFGEVNVIKLSIQRRLIIHIK